jgi:hypothetical protein
VAFSPTLVHFCYRHHSFTIVASASCTGSNFQLVGRADSWFGAATNLVDNREIWFAVHIGTDGPRPDFAPRLNYIDALAKVTGN